MKNLSKERLQVLGFAYGLSLVTGLSLSLISSSAKAADQLPVLSGTGKTQFNSLLQAWGLNDTTAVTAASGANPALTPFNFRLRRAEFRFQGSVVENTRWFVMLDAAKAIGGTDLKPLQDIGVAFTPASVSSDIEFIAGQFKLPTTAEGLDPSAELLFPERSIVGRRYGDLREPGFMAVYKPENFRLSAMVSNGRGPNADDVTSAKDLSVRAEYTAMEMLKVGAYTTAGDFKYSTKARYGGNARLSLDRFQWRVEGGKANESGNLTGGVTTDVSYYVLDELQPAVRYTWFDSGTYSSNVTTVGLNYYFSKHNSKIQFSYDFLNDATGNSGSSNGSTTPARGQKGSLAILAFQAAI